MRNRFLILLGVMAFAVMSASAQTYQSLWDEVERAQQKDLPQTAVASLRKIARKAERDRNAGQLLRSTLLEARLESEVAPDSLLPAVERLKAKERSQGDAVIKSVYAAVLCQVLSQNAGQLGDSAKAQALYYREQALLHPDMLASVSDASYAPFVVTGRDRASLENNMLSVVALELRAWSWLHDAAQRMGWQQTACLAALWMMQEDEKPGFENYEGSRYIARLDSLSERYAHLDVAGEVAIERYNYMSHHTDATPAQRAAYLDSAIERWKGWKRIGELRNGRTLLATPQFTAVIPKNIALPQEAQTVRLTALRNVGSLTMRVYRTTLAGNTELNPNVGADFATIRRSATELTDLRRTCRFGQHADYETFADSLTLSGLPVGVYVLEFSTQPATSVRRVLYFVTQLRVMSLPEPKGQMRYVVVDAATGQPVEGASVVVKPMTRRNADDGFTLITKDSGEANLKLAAITWRTVYASTSTDKACPLLHSNSSFSYYDTDRRQEYTNIFTDRAIYRPGQTVHMAAIITQLSGHVNTSVVAGKQVTARLYDANYKVVAEQTLTTDDYGKCAAQFTLPTGTLDGQFTIRVNNAAHGIRVEEYKRPVFQVTFDEYNGSYQTGDTITLTGHAMSYAGVPVQGAKVNFVVRRRMAWWWLGCSWYWRGWSDMDAAQSVELLSGTATTGDDGSFAVRMPLVLPVGSDPRRPMFYHFDAEATVTDVAGESHSAVKSMPLGTRPSSLTCDIQQKVRADQLKPVTFWHRNAAGSEIAGTVRYRMDGGKWKECAANSKTDILGGMPKSGTHRIEACCEADSIDISFVVFSLDDKVPASETHDWFYQSSERFPADGSEVTLQTGASDTDLYMVYELVAGDSVIERGYQRENSSLWNRKMTYRPEYGNGLLFNVAWVKDGVTYHHTTTIGRPLPDKQLKLQWHTFRDRLQPGQKEEWRLVVTDKDGRPASAQLMAVLYDKSLDQLQQHGWQLSVPFSTPMPHASWQTLAVGDITTSGEQDYRLLSVDGLDFSRFDHDVFPVYSYGRMVRMRGAKMLYAKEAAVGSMDAMPLAANTMDMAVEEKVVAGMNVAGTDVAIEQDAAVADGAVKQDDAVQMRENLQETAFFYPSLVTDEKGHVALRFILPESLTTWRFLGLAHTADMKSGLIDGEAVAQKPLMIQPNVPRFVRVGDEAQLSVRIFSMSDEAQQGMVRIQLVNPENDAVVYQYGEPFDVEHGKTAVATFHLPTAQFGNLSLLVCRVTADAGNCSDGEQHYLPVLPNSERVTVSVPITQHGKGTVAINIPSLFPETSVAPRKLTIEYANNPAWLMVQSLATLGQPWEHNAINQAAAYYSNLLASNILKQSPQARTVFEQWLREPNGETLASNLSKNDELKDIVLSETPWVDNAEKEAEQKQRLADFFDANLIGSRMDNSLTQLSKLQNGDGAFTWYPGMPSSLYITTAVAELLARLKVLTGSYADASDMQTKAMRYIGREIVDMVNEMKRQARKGRKPTFPSFTALRWLYIAAIDGRQLPSDVAAADDYLIELLKKEIKNQTIYEKALTAVILQKRGEHQRAAQYVQSLKEYSVATPEMGRYYDTPRATYSWYSYKIPTEVAAMEAIRLVTPDDVTTIDEMRRWLLQEKRSQVWDTPISTVNAIYAFLNGNSQQLDSRQHATISIDGQPLKMPQATAAIGYVKTAVDEPNGTELTVSKPSDGTSWGAVYAQFFQPTSDMASSASGISVKREIVSDGGNHVPLGIGSRIKVRITINSTRDLDFVQVVDRRAACMEPVRQLSGYSNGAYCVPKDNATNYYYHWLSKGTHVLETEYYIDRAGRYETGTCCVLCAYSPEFRATAPSMTLTVNRDNNE